MSGLAPEQVTADQQAVAAALGAVDRCPSCGATVREADDWCGQCYTSLRPPAPDPQLAELAERVEPAAPAAPAEPAADPLTDPLTGPLTGPLVGPSGGEASPRRGRHRRASTEPEPPPEIPTWTCRRCAEVALVTEPRCAVCGFSPLDDSDPINGAFARVAGPLHDPQKRVLVMVGGTVVMLGVLFLAFTILGLVL